jgi:hypothetical protein
MSKPLVRSLFLLCALVLAYFALSLVSNLAHLASFIDLNIPGAGLPVFWGMLTAFSLLLFAPVVIYLRLPKPLIPPDDTSPEALATYRDQVRAQLRRNPLLAETALDTDEQLDVALAVLGRATEQLIRNTASAVFVSTAVMQNGRLDGLIVLASQLRMLWRIAHIYNSRPSPRQMLYLTTQVGANALIADSIQEIDFAEITAPVVAAIVPSMKGGIPGLQGISALLVNSVANGCANAFLTLRIGLSARAYSEALRRPEAATVRQQTSATALRLVSAIAREQGRAVVRKSWESVRNTVVEATEATVDGTKAAVSAAAEKTLDGANSVLGRMGHAWGVLKNRR